MIDLVLGSKRDKQGAGPEAQNPRVLVQFSDFTEGAEVETKVTLGHCLLSIRLFPRK